MERKWEHVRHLGVRGLLACKLYMHGMLHSTTTYPLGMLHSRDK